LYGYIKFAQFFRKQFFVGVNFNECIKYAGEWNRPQPSSSPQFSLPSSGAVRLHLLIVDHGTEHSTRKRRWQPAKSKNTAFSAKSGVRLAAHHHTFSDLHVPSCGGMPSCGGSPYNQKSVQYPTENFANPKCQVKIVSNRNFL
jgi:hypothetical protein